MVGLILKSADLDRTIPWYQAAGFRLLDRVTDSDRDWCALGLDDTVVQFVAGNTPWSGSPSMTGCVYVAVVDIEVAKSGLAEPVVAEWGIEDRAWGTREIVLRDPDGYFVTLTGPPT